MSYADDVFVEMCRDIIDHGTDTTGEKVRPKWEDGSSAYTIKKFGVVNRYDLSKEFPVQTLRPIAVKTCVDEMLWIWQKKSNNIKDLKGHIWDAWADENGSIGKAYGYQMGVKHPYKDIKEEGLKEAFSDVRIVHADVQRPDDVECDTEMYAYSRDRLLAVYKNGAWCLDQVDRVIYDLKLNPFSRRIMTNIYVHQDLNEMNLYPCAYSMTFNVTEKKGSGKLILNGILNQRSQDILAANNWNVCQYAVLLYILAQVCDMQAGEFIHVIADAHIYDRHIPLIEELISRPRYPAPVFWIDPNVKDFYDFTVDDLRLVYHQTGPQIRNIPIAE